MRIGLIVPLNGAPGGDQPPTWKSVLSLATAAEAVGFNSFVFEDALLYRGKTTTNGVWESMSIAAGLAASTERIEIGQSVINTPYRSPALTAKMAETIDEISGGRYIFGIGAGNTADSDYEAFGFPTDHRYSRFAEAIEIIHGLMKNGEVDFTGNYMSAGRAEMVLRGPRAGGPPILIAGAKPKMLRLVVRYGDAWNWWTTPGAEAREALDEVVAELGRACAESDRDPATLRRTLDYYSIEIGGDPVSGVLAGTADAIADELLQYRELGFDEVRCNPTKHSVESVEAMAGLVDLIHAG